MRPARGIVRRLIGAGQRHYRNVFGPYVLKRGPAGAFVVYREREPAACIGELHSRKLALVEYGAACGLNRLLLDYRAVELPVNADFFSAVLQCKAFMERDSWQVAVLVDPATPHDTVEMAQHLAMLLAGMGQRARCFNRYEDAQTWLSENLVASRLANSTFWNA